MTDPRQPAYDAVFAYIRSQPRDFLPSTVVDRNAMIWRAVHAALDAMEVPKAHQERNAMPDKYARHCLLDLLGPAGDTDDLIGQVEKAAVQSAAQKLLHLHAETLLTHGPGVAQGLLLAYKHIAPDPYYKEEPQA